MRCSRYCAGDCKTDKYSPKRSHLFSQELAEAESDSVVTVKSLCTTRWTARTSAIDAVLKDYSILIETMCVPFR